MGARATAARPFPGGAAAGQGGGCSDEKEEWEAVGKGEERWKRWKRGDVDASVGFAHQRGPALDSLQ
jgi:hypothetical protein